MEYPQEDREYLDWYMRGIPVLTLKPEEKRQLLNEYMAGDQPRHKTTKNMGITHEIHDS